MHSSRAKGKSATLKWSHMYSWNFPFGITKSLSISREPQPRVIENQVLSVTCLSRSEYFFYKIPHPLLSLPVFSCLGFLTREMERNVIYINHKLEDNVDSRKSRVSLCRKII